MEGLIARKIDFEFIPNPPPPNPPPPQSPPPLHPQKNPL